METRDQWISVRLKGQPGQVPGQLGQQGDLVSKQANKKLKNYDLGRQIRLYMEIKIAYK